MGGRHSHAFVGDTGGPSPVHTLPAHLKVVALLGFVSAVVAAPRQSVWPYAAFLALLVVVIAIAGLRVGGLARKLAIEIPFVLFALLMPFIATGPKVVVLGLAVSQPGLWAAWALLAKGTLGVLAALVLANTTSPQDLLAGLERLRMPQQMVGIMGFMIRYAEVIWDQWRRMSVARASRGFVARTPASWRVLGTSLGGLFIRSYERGERVHLAMLSRGYNGTMPPVLGRDAAASRAAWAAVAGLPATAALVTAIAWVTL